MEAPGDHDVPGFDGKPGDVMNCPRVCMYIPQDHLNIFSQGRFVGTYGQCETVDRAVAVWSMISYRSGKQK